MNKNVLSVTLSCLLAASGMAMADEHKMPHDDKQDMHGTEIQRHHAFGKVNKVDMHKGVINMTHGPIKSLGWMGMTMDFKVKDKDMLKGLRPGQRVKFDVVKEGPGKFYIVDIETSK